MAEDLRAHYGTAGRVEMAVDARAVQRRLTELRERGEDLTPAMQEIAGHLLDGVNEAFAGEASPAGSPGRR